MRYSLMVAATVWLTGCGPQTASSITADLPSHVAPGFASLHRLGRMDAEQTLRLHVALPLHDRDGLDTLIAEQANPTSPLHRAYLTPAQFSQRFHPTAEEFASVAQTLQSAGFTVQGHQGALLNVSARVDDIENFFGTHLYNYVDDNGAPAFAPVHEISIPEGMQIAAVAGLSSMRSTRVHPLAGNLPGNPTAFAPTDIRNAYNIPAGSVSGKGQSIALVELSGYLPEDVASYDQLYNLPAAPLYNVIVDNAPPVGPGGEAEVVLDIQMVQIFAPDITQIVVYQAPNPDSTSLFNELANPTLVATPPPIMSYSWGLGENNTAQSDFVTEGNLFAQMAAQGQTFLAASGDAGAKCDGKVLCVLSPSSQTYVVSVGGTTLNMTGTQVTGESAWQGGGGGISIYAKPGPWQPNSITAASLGSQAMRTMPDVSMNAGSGYDGFVMNDQHASYGGTSLSTPLWATVLTLANGKRAAKNLPPLGFAAPLFYAIGNSADYGTVFKDIADGSDNGMYPAVKGYDAATGWGVVKGLPMLDLLSRGYPHVTMQAPILQESP